MVLNQFKRLNLQHFYRSFHRFGQAKFPDGGLILGSSQLTLMPQLPLPKNDAQFKSGQNQLENKQLALLI